MKLNIKSVDICSNAEISQFKQELPHIPHKDQNKLDCVREYESSGSSVTQSTASLVTTKEVAVKPEMKEPILKKLGKRLKLACDFGLFRDYKFVLFTLAHTLFSAAFLIPSSFMPARAVSYGISKTDASLLVSAMGITNLISRPVCGLLMDIGPIKRNRFYLFICWVTLSGALSLYSFGPTLEAQMTYAILYGMAQGVYYVPFSLLLQSCATKYVIIYF